VQLTDGAGSRYERVSDACEAARRLAKKHHVVVILVSQVSRKQGDQKQVREVSLHDAKESGSFENSCSLVLGLWKTSKTTMRCRVLKNSRGLSGNTVEISIRGGTYILDPGR
jgi:replicative DNA helicase